MSILTFVKGVEKISKDDILSSIETQLEIANSINNNITLAQSVNKADFDSIVKRYPLANRINVELNRVIGGKFSLFAGFKIVNNNIIGFLKGAETYFEKSKIKEYTQIDLTVRDANYLNMVSGIEFIHRYFNVLFNGLLDLALDESTKFDKLYDKPDFELLNNTSDMFIKGISEFANRGVGWIKALNELPDVKIDEESYQVLANTLSADQLELTKVGFGFHNLNPIYYYKRIRLHFDLKRLERIDLDNSFYALKIQQLADKMDGVNNLQVEGQIKYYADKIKINKHDDDAIRRRYE